MTEQDIEECRWRAMRILNADHGRVSEWQKKQARIFLSQTKPGRHPDARAISEFREAWRQYWASTWSSE